MIKYFISCILFLIFTNAEAGFNFLNDYRVSHYVGMELHHRNMDMPTHFGGNVFHKTHPQVHGFTGLRIGDYVGIEVGYHSTNNKIKYSTIDKGHSVLGQVVSDGPQYFLSKSRVEGYQLGTLFYYPVHNPFYNSILNNKIELLGYAGITYLKVNYQNILLKVENVPHDISTGVFDFKSQKSILKLGIGAQYVYCHSGIRFMINYENTKQFRNLHPLNYPSKPHRLKFNDSLSLGVGIFIITS